MTLSIKHIRRSGCLTSLIGTMVSSIAVRIVEEERTEKGGYAEDGAIVVAIQESAVVPYFNFVIELALRHPQV
jgi:hypothetical protein